MAKHSRENNIKTFTSIAMTVILNALLLRVVGLTRVVKGFK